MPIGSKKQPQPQQQPQPRQQQQQKQQQHKKRRSPVSESDHSDSEDLNEENIFGTLKKKKMQNNLR
jgi:hypothetical protein